MEACRQGDLDTSRQLLDAGAEPSCADEGGVTPLMLAAEAGNEELVTALLGESMLCALHSCLLLCFFPCGLGKYLAKTEHQVARRR